MQPQDYVLVSLLFVLAGCGVAALTFAARYLRAQLGDAKYADIERAVRTYVQAAEQMVKSGQITKDARFDWVVTQIAGKFPQLSKGTIIALVESAVYMLNLGAEILAPLNIPVQEGEIKEADGSLYVVSDRGNSTAVTFKTDAG